MRYHVYTEARHPTGAVAAGHSLTVYDDAARTIESDIYAAASGGSPLANPCVVPATGIVDFWATVPEPYVVASGDATPRPLSIVVATPGDIGALGLNSNDVVTGTPTFANAMCVGALPIAFASPVATRSAGVGCDATSLFIQLFDTALGGAFTPDRLNVQTTSPGRVQMGSTASASMDDAGTPFFMLAADNVDPNEDCFHLEFPDGQVGSVLNIHPRALRFPSRVGLVDDILDLDPAGNLTTSGGLTAGGDVRADGDFEPAKNNESRVGSAARAFKTVYLSDGDDTWALTIDSSGAVTTAKLVVNYCMYPSCELDSNSDGLADGWTLDNTDVAGTPVCSIVAALGANGSYAQRVQYTGVSGDTNQNLYILSYGPAGSFAPGDPVSVSLLAKGSATGVKVELRCLAQNWRGGAFDGDGNRHIDLTGSAVRYEEIGGTMPAGTTSCTTFIMVSGISEGDTLDITIDDILPVKASTAPAYFDGRSEGAEWDGPVDASISVQG